MRTAGAVKVPISAPSELKGHAPLKSRWRQKGSQANRGGAESGAKIGRLHLRIFEELPAGSGQRQTSLLDYIGPVRQLQRGESVLLDHDDRGARGLDAFNHLEDAIDDVRRETQRGFVKHDELWTRHERSRNR